MYGTYVYVYIYIYIICAVYVRILCSKYMYSILYVDILPLLSAHHHQAAWCLTTVCVVQYQVNSISKNLKPVA